MRKTMLTLFVAFAALTCCPAQKIEMEKIFGGYKCTQNGREMTMADLVSTMEHNSEASELIKQARTGTTFATILGGAGGFFIGFPVGTALGGGDTNWVMAGIGAGLIAVAIPISSHANKKAVQAVELYNSSLPASAFYKFEPEFNVIAGRNGIGLSMNF